MEGRDLSSRQAQQVVRNLEIGQPINSENRSETADGVTRESESAEEAQVLWSALADRFAACKLVLHPETKIVYCKDANRRGDFPIISFDFLWDFEFRARKTMWREGTKRIFAHSFQPAASPKALSSISRTIRSAFFRVCRRGTKGCKRVPRGRPYRESSPLSRHCVTRRYPTFTEIFLDLGDKALSRHDEQGKLSLDEPIGPHSGRYQVQG